MVAFWQEVAVNVQPLGGSHYVHGSECTHFDWRMTFCFLLRSDRCDPRSEECKVPESETVENLTLEYNTTRWIMTYTGELHHVSSRKTRSIMASTGKIEKNDEKPCKQVFVHAHWSTTHTMKYDHTRKQRPLRPRVVPS